MLKLISETGCPICWRAFGLHIDRHVARSYSLTPAGIAALRAWEAKQ